MISLCKFKGRRDWIYAIRAQERDSYNPMSETNCMHVEWQADRILICHVKANFVLNLGQDQQQLSIITMVTSSRPFEVWNIQLQRWDWVTSFATSCQSSP